MSINIIAEVANGYYGNLLVSKWYVDAALKAGATAVKFQIAYASDVLEQSDPIFDIIKNNEMSVEEWLELREYAKNSGILFYVDLDGLNAIKVADKISPDGIKIHTTSFFDERVVSAAFRNAKTVLVSVSGITFEEIAKFLLKIEKKYDKSKVVLLYGYQAVPTPVEVSYLKRLNQIQERFPTYTLGYMDHVGAETDDKTNVSLLALSQGFTWFEKHLTLSRYLSLIDSKSALEPREFESYVDTLNRLWPAQKDLHTDLYEEEELYREQALTKLVAINDMSKGDILQLDNITHKRIISIEERDMLVNPELVVGKVLTQDIHTGTPLLMRYFK